MTLVTCEVCGKEYYLELEYMVYQEIFLEKIYNDKGELIGVKFCCHSCVYKQCLK